MPREAYAPSLRDTPVPKGHEHICTGKFSCSIFPLRLNATPCAWLSRGLCSISQGQDYCDSSEPSPLILSRQ
jgi:hypothetical protein